MEVILRQNSVILINISNFYPLPMPEFPSYGENIILEFPLKHVFVFCSVSKIEGFMKHKSQSQIKQHL
jgi:hypothetical protein